MHGAREAEIQAGAKASSTQLTQDAKKRKGSSGGAPIFGGTR